MSVTFKAKTHMIRVSIKQQQTSKPESILWATDPHASKKCLDQETKAEKRSLERLLVTRTFFCYKEH